VSQLHARAIRRLRDALGQLGSQPLAEMDRVLVQPKMRKAELRAACPAQRPAAGMVLPYSVKRPVPARALFKVDRPRRAMAADR